MAELLSVEIVTAAISALALLSGSASWFFYRRKARVALENTYQQTLQLWSAVLTKTEGDYSWILSNPEKLVLGNPSYTSESKSAHRAAQLLWVSWAAERHVLEARYKRSAAIFEEYRACSRLNPNSQKLLQQALALLVDGSETLKISHLPSELATLAPMLNQTVVEVADLPTSVQNNGAAAAAQLKRFVDAKVKVQETLKEIEREINGDQDTSIRVLKNTLVRAGLPVAPYEMRFADIDSSWTELAAKLTADPLGPHADMSEKMKHRLAMLRNRVQRVLTAQSSLVTHRRLVAELKTRTEAVRAIKVESTLPELQMDKCFTLDEPGFAVDGPLAECDKLLGSLQKALESGSSTRFIRDEGELRLAMAEVERLTQQARCDQMQVGSTLVRLTDYSTASDAEADVADRRAVVELYRAQRWNGALQAANRLMERQQLRIEVRNNARRLQQSITHFAQQLEQHSATISPDIEANFAEVTAAGAEVARQCEQGLADWNKLSERISALAETFKADRPNSLVDALQAEISARTAASAGAVRLETRLRDLQTHINAKWGGNRAADGLNAILPAVQTALSRLQIPKQNWQAVLRATEDALRLTEPINDDIQSEMRRHGKLQTALTELKQRAQQTKALSYETHICDIAYGQGVYCTTDIVEELAKAAEQTLAARDYDSTAAKLDEALLRLHRNHLECWWLVLGMMAFSDECCARKYALDQGYRDGQFESWMQSKVTASSNLWNPPPITYNAHVGSKPHLKFLRSRASDAASAIDYEPVQNSAAS